MTSGGKAGRSGWRRGVGRAAVGQRPGQRGIPMRVVARPLARWSLLVNVVLRPYPGRSIGAHPWRPTLAPRSPAPHLRAACTVPQAHVCKYGGRAAPVQVRISRAPVVRSFAPPGRRRDEWQRAALRTCELVLIRLGCASFMAGASSSAPTPNPSPGSFSNRRSEEDLPGEGRFPKDTSLDLNPPLRF